MRGRRLQIEWREDKQTLYDRYKQEKDHQNRTRLQALWLLRRGHTMKEVAPIVGVHYRTLQEWVLTFGHEFGQGAKCLRLLLRSCFIEMGKGLIKLAN